MVRRSVFVFHIFLLCLILSFLLKGPMCCTYSGACACVRHNSTYVNVKTSSTQHSAIPNGENERIRQCFLCLRFCLLLSFLLEGPMCCTFSCAFMCVTSDLLLPTHTWLLLLMVLIVILPNSCDNNETYFSQLNYEMTMVSLFYM